jgi:sortase A
MPSGPRGGSPNEEGDEFEPLPTNLELAMAMAAATAYDIPQPRPRGSFLATLSPVERVIAVGIAGLAFCGIALVGNGFYIKGKAELSQILLRRAFTAELHGENAKPWPGADFTTVAEVRAPRLGKKAIVLSGASGQALAFGPAWIGNTPQPGEEGISVIAATSGTHLRWLRNVKPGDDIVITRRDGTMLTFKADESRKVRCDETTTDVAPGDRRLLLTTCPPSATAERGPMRYAVEAELVDTTPTASIQPQNTKPLSAP